MLRSWDTIATNYKNMRMRLMTAGLALFLIYLVAIPYFTPKPLKIETITATISHAGEHTTINGKNAYDTRFRLPDDSQIEMWVMDSPHPNTGDKVPLDAEHYDNEKVYRINYMKWRLGEYN